ncbi:phytanoyl-CoA dioxygenase family protein [Stigmatella aurantiaca]|uniref:Phytanoyl-CoA dioxygenase, PhyH family n=1 Tax=Stigmatella aurantiaca (strain DW4/3-1) TaxID=378806 RepID=Q08U43_STIAD|nr:phytanoyl-CoA dioxygenase family protein [Stigmatella aurantiaca]EAU64001.1 phytanoyl-CoA dioxygenase, PhyH family [Stigmatella aurantiaca DW4/3-1]
MAAVTTLDRELVETYQRDGAVCVRGLFNPELVRLARQAIDAVLANPSELAIVASRPDDPGRFIEDFCNWQRIPLLEELVRKSPAAAAAGELMKASVVRFFHDHILVKEPGTRQHTPWHQDQPYYNVDGVQGCSMWLPVDPVSRSSTLELVAGSHRGPWFLPRTFLDNQAKWFPEGKLAELPDIHNARDRFPIVGWDSSRAMRFLPLPHAPCLRGSGRPEPPQGPFSALPRR